MHFIVLSVPGSEGLVIPMNVFISRSSASISATWPAAWWLTGSVPSTMTSPPPIREGAAVEGYNVRLRARRERELA
jgi:hypothetical protein